jgi:hypothetical protein
MGKESLFKIAGREKVQHDASKECSFNRATFISVTKFLLFQDCKLELTSVFEITTDGISTMAKPITNDSTKKGKYNMIPDFCKNDLTP